MNEQNKKLEKVSKSCKAISIVSRILGIIAIVGCTLGLIGAIAILSLGKKFDDAVLQQDPGNVNVEVSVAGFTVGEVSPDEIANLAGDWESSIPALQKAFDERPISLGYGMYCIMISVIAGIVAAVLILIANTFKLITKEGTPFTKTVAKRMLITMIILTVVAALTMGTGTAIIGGLLTWVVYSILDYGIVLQTESDETL